VRDTEEHLKRYEAQLDTKSARIAELEASIQTLQKEFNAERTGLIDRIQLNAQGVLEEFRNSLGLTLGRLLNDLPSAEGTISPDLAKSILVRAHQVVESLEERGVKMHTSKITGRSN
jgi:hypothetical protein